MNRLFLAAALVVVWGAATLIEAVRDSRETARAVTRGARARARTANRRPF